MLGFIIIRHVNNHLSDFYWKECYTCIRKWYDNPIMIIDDSSSKEFLIENLALVNTTVIYDTTHPGAAELLPYYYFHLLHPFDKAIILHDSVFLQQRLNVSPEPVQMLWTFPHHWDDEIFHLIDALLVGLPHYKELLSLYWQKSKWDGCFGMMCSIDWTMMDSLNRNYQLWDTLLPKITKRENRMALERVLGLLIAHHYGHTPTSLGDIHSYMKWGLTFPEYLTNDKLLPLMKVWSSR